MSSSHESLHDGFARFVHAAEELEASYASLRQRAASVDDELQATNAKLEQALAERDGMFAALPIGLVALRGDSGEAGASNVEADRLVAAAAAVGEDLLARPDGTVVFDGSAPEGFEVVIGGAKRDTLTVRRPEWAPTEGLLLPAAETVLRAPKPRRVRR